MMRALVRLPLARLRKPRSLLPSFGWSALAVAAALSSRSSGLPTGADHVLRGTFAFAVLPLLTYGIVSATFGGRGLRESTQGLVAIGGSPRASVLSSIVVAMAASAFAGGLVAALVCVLAHGNGDPPLLWDLPASFGVAFVGGVAYAAYFALGSSIGRGALRGVFLALDFLLGSAGGFGALLTPRAHVVSLLGGPASFDLSRRASSIVLVALTLAYLGLAVVLGRRVRR